MKKRKFTPRERKLISERALRRCEYCQWFEKYTNGFYEREHIDPRARDGAEELYNIAFSCQPCNNAKSDKVEGFDDVTGTTVPLYNPRTQNWLDHFEWSEDFTFIVGVTPIGRVTVSTLRLNRPNLVGLREIFRDLGIHPPTEY